MTKKWKFWLLVPAIVTAASIPLVLTSCADPALFDLDQRNNIYNEQDNQNNGGNSNNGNSNSPGGNFSGGGDERPY